MLVGVFIFLIMGFRVNRKSEFDRKYIDLYMSGCIEQRKYLFCREVDEDLDKAIFWKKTPQQVFQLYTLIDRLRGLLDYWEAWLVSFSARRYRSRLKSESKKQ